MSANKLQQATDRWDRKTLVLMPACPKLAKPAGSSNWQACRLALDGQNPSLSICIGDDGRVLLYCHAAAASRISARGPVKLPTEDDNTSRIQPPWILWAEKCPRQQGRTSTGPNAPKEICALDHDNIGKPNQWSSAMLAKPCEEVKIMGRDRMLRVSREKPCPIFGKSDWCLAQDESVAICPRTELGSIKRYGNAGWLHILKQTDWRRRVFQHRQIRLNPTQSDLAKFAENIGSPSKRHYT